MKSDFADNSSVLFGREHDLAYLLERSRVPGVTAVIGQPQMGKSWLLTEAARQLSCDGWTSHAPLPGALSLAALPPLVGLVESQGESADMLPRAVQDLYTRWLSDSSYWQQAGVVIEQQKKDWVGRMGEAVGGLVSRVAILHGKGAEVVAGLVKQTFEGLATANRELLSGGMQLPRLQIEDSQELLSIVYKVTGRPAVLVFDQWEKSPALEKEAGILDTFMRHMPDWPPCHIFLGTRADEKPRKLLRQLAASYPGAAEVHELGPMDLAPSASGQAMLAFVRSRVPATHALADDELLQLVSGYPRVLAQWTSSYNAPRVQSRADLAQVAQDATAYRYPEFGDLLPNLSETERLLAIRLVLLPASGNREDWAALRPLVLLGCPAKTLDSLLRGGVLEASSPPSYGHAKRAEAAMAWMTANCHEEMREIAELLVTSLAENVFEVSVQWAPFINSVAQLRDAALHLELSSLPRALCEAAHSLGAAEDFDTERLANVTRIVSNPAQVALLAIGIYNALTVKEDAQLDEREAWLQALQELAQAYPADAVVLDRLAKALSNMLLYAKQAGALKRRDELLVHVRQLTAQHAATPGMREQMAITLYNTLLCAEQEGDPQRRDALLNELQQLAAAYPRDETVSEWLAKCLSNTLVDARRDGNLQRRDQLLDSLRTLAAAFAQNAAICIWFANGLNDTLQQTADEHALWHREPLFAEMRSLAARFASDPDVQLHLAIALNNGIFYANQEGAPHRRDSLLEELLQVFAANSESEPIRGQVARDIFMTSEGMRQEPERRLPLLDSLREFAGLYPNDAYIKKVIAVVDADQ
jgi:hypothetical protein